MPDTPFVGAQPTCVCGEAASVQWLRRHPTESSSVIAVYSCRSHAITLDAAAQVHEPTCTAPNPAHVPGCSCTPEPLPAPEPAFNAGPTVTLPTGWSLPA